MDQIVILDNILEGLYSLRASQRKFLHALFFSIFMVQGRTNHKNLSRYMDYHANTISNHFNSPVDFCSFHQRSVNLVIEEQNPDTWILAVDCSYIPKSGKHTTGMGQFWSGCANRAVQGLEISVAALVKADGSEAYAVEVIQTPGDLSEKEGEQEDYTRTDFYIDQLRRMIKRYPWLRYIVADGYYMKEKVLVFMEQQTRAVLISKLRRNADLKFYLDRDKNPDAHGNKVYEAKFNHASPLDQLSLWNYEGQLDNIKVYSQIMYSPYYKKDLKVALCIHPKRGHALLASDDLALEGKKMLRFYKSRFQIEFIFRDAKQFAGLNHCQARNARSLDYHFNTSIASVNLSRIKAKLNGEQDTFSFNDLKREKYNQTILKEFLQEVDLDLSSPQIRQAYDKTCQFGLMRA